MSIKFGTDGWRGVISDDFTFENVRIVAQAIASYFRSRTKGKIKMAVGYDNRFLAEKFASTIADVLSRNGISVLLSSTSVPSPVVSLTVKQRNLPGGVMVTASHNPPDFCGIKVKASYGGSATPEMTKEIEKNLFKEGIKLIPSEYGTIEKEDLNPPLLKAAKSMIDFDLIKKAELNIIADPLYGSGDSHLEKVLAGTNCRVRTIHNHRDALFGGLNPEPIEENLRELADEVKKNSSDIGLSVDGDADRIGVVDDEGSYLAPHHVFPLLLLYFIREKKMTGRVVQTISLGYLSERIARKYKLEFIEIPVGFKYVADWMLKPGGVLIGGEESGGYGYRGYIPERDGLLSSLFFVEMLAKTKRKLSALRREMQEEFGLSFYKRIDYHYDPGKFQISDKDKFVRDLAAKSPKKLLDMPVEQIKTLDGIEFVFKDGYWLLMRPSGTEPLMRMYAETDNEEKTKKLLDAGKKLVFG